MIDVHRYLCLPPSKPFECSYCPVFLWAFISDGTLWYLKATHKLMVSTQCWKGFRDGYYGGALVIMVTISFEKVEVVMLEISYLIDVLRYLKVYFGLLKCPQWIQSFVTFESKQDSTEIELELFEK